MERTADESVEVTSFDEANFESALDVLSETARSRDVTPESRQLPPSDQSKPMQQKLKDEDGQNEQQNQKDEHGGRTSTIRAEEKLQATVQGKNEVRAGSSKEPAKITKEDPIYVETIQFSPSRYSLIVTHLKDEIRQIVSALKAESPKAKILHNDRNRHLVIKGNKAGLMKAREGLEKLERRIIVHRETVTDRLEVMFLLSAFSCKGLESLGRQHGAAFSRLEEESGIKHRSLGGQQALAPTQEPQKTPSQAQPHQVPDTVKQASMVDADIDTQATSGAVQFEVMPIGLQFIVQHGDITDQAVGAIVNSTNSKLDLMQGAVAKMLREKCGPRLEEECQKIAATVQATDLGVTSAPNLPAKFIMHLDTDYLAFVNGWEDGIVKCLEEAEKRGIESLAIPAFGTGVHNVKPRDSALMILKAVTRFCLGNPTKLRKIHVVIYEANMIPPFVSAAEAFSDKVKKIQKKSAACRVKDGDTQAKAEAVEFEVMPGELQFVVQQGDITNQAVGAIVNSTNSKLDLSKGAVAKTLREKCGPRLEQECRQIAPAVQATGLGVTSAPNLPTQSIIHLDTERLSRSNSWEDGIVKCLEEAEKRKIQSLAIPAFGTGAYNMKPADSAVMILKAVTRFCLGNPTELTRTHAVIFDSNMLPPFVNAAETFDEIVKKKTPFQRLKGAFSPRQQVSASPVLQPSSVMRVTGSETGPRRETLFVYGVSPQAVQSAIRAFKTKVAEQCEKEVITHEAIKHMDTTQVEKVQRLCRKHSVEWKMAQKHGRLVLYGLNKDVHVTHEQVKYLLHAADMETRKRSSDIGNLPEFWASHGDSEQVKMVELRRNSVEYGEVETNFTSTLSCPATVQIVAIHRIQNPALYLQFLVKKDQMEKQNGTAIQNEKTLWHGTSADAIKNINLYGFNRSYCGKNATMYGEGTYFAVNSSYSQQKIYSPPDGSEKRHMYQCKVLVGYTVKGERGMKVLPARDGHIHYDSAADNEQNPGIYVIFNDTQAYPEYLIVFKQTFK